MRWQRRATECGASFMNCSDADLPNLDQSEGFRPGRSDNSYWRATASCSSTMTTAARFRRLTYFAERQPNPPRPNQAYKDLIVAGARRWGLPAHYIAELERIEVDP